MDPFGGLGRTNDPLWAVSPDGSELRVVFETGRGAELCTGAVHPSWSPDGEYILFGLDPPGTISTLTEPPPNELCVILADGSDLTCIIDTSDHKIWTEWAAGP